jgi:hypothetical protein
MANPEQPPILAYRGATASARRTYGSVPGIIGQRKHGVLRVASRQGTGYTEKHVRSSRDNTLTRFNREVSS